MIPPWDAPTPVHSLYRIGRAPDPLAWIPWQFVGEGRFDDPARRYRVLYAGERRVCFLEALAQFRPTLQGAVTRRFASDWLASRRIARFALDDPNRRGRWLDLREPSTYQRLRRSLAPRLIEFGVPDFDLSSATGQDLSLTQAVSAWAYDQGYDGIAYPTRFDPALACWAIFERRNAVPLTGIDVQPIDPNDLDLLAVADLFGLPLAT